MDRRSFIGKLSKASISYALLDHLLVNDVLGKAVTPITQHWAKQLQEVCLDLQLAKIPQVLWQSQVEALFQKIPLEDLLQFINFEFLAKSMVLPDLGVTTKPVVFPKLEGIPEKTVFIKKIFGLQKDRAIIPHGHANMASAHLVLKGEFAVRHYEKVAEEAKHLLVRPTIDKISAVGDCSSISDERDNIHWFIANTRQAFTFDVIMLNLNHQPYDIHNIDIVAAEQTSEGLLRAKKLDVEVALQKYGKRHH